MVAPTLDMRPREERDLKEIYPDLDETAQLAVIAVTAAAKHNGSNGKTHASTQRPAGVTKRQRSTPPITMYPCQVAAYGFRAPRPRKGSPTYIRANATPHARQVRYDMDEQDALFLEWRNAQDDNRAVILPEVFEIVMTVLEEEWHKLEAQMGGAGTEHELKMDMTTEKYGSDDGVGGAGSLSEQRCAVCSDLECDNANAIVFCDGCNIAVHQECYGIAFIPEGQWFCRRCMLSRGRAVECSFCPSQTGAFKQLDNGLWSHVVCALWIHEVYFANPIYMEPIEGINQIPRTRWKLTCYICKQRTGACIQCTNRNCFQAYHVTCGKRAGLYMAMDKGVQGALALKALLRLFCDRHGPSEWSRETVLRGIAKTRTFYRDRRLLSERNDLLASQRRQENQRSSFKWRTEHNTPIAPQKFADVVYATLLQLKVESTVGEVPSTANTMLRGLGLKTQMLKQDVLTHLRTASSGLCKYWCLKREAKRGAPLVRPSALVTLAAHIYEMDALGDNEVARNELKEKIEFGQTLAADLRRVVELAQLTRHRQATAYAATELALHTAEVAHFPLLAVAHRVLVHMADKVDHTRVLAGYRLKAGGLTLRDIMANVADYKYGQVEGLDRDIQKWCLQIAHEHKPSSTVGKAAARWLGYWRDVARDEIGGADPDGRIPFVAVDGLKLSLKPHDAHAVLAAEELSESENDPLEQGDNRAVWRRFMAER